MAALLACLQMSSGPDRDDNLRVLTDMIRAAAAGGATFIAAPENACCMMADRDRKRAMTVSESDHPFLPAVCDLAKSLNVYVLIGSLAVRAPDGRVFNRSFLIAPTGIVARYDKIHLFDADLASGERYRESDGVAPGNQAVVAATPLGPVGLSICYDVRFPHLYRALAKAGARILTIPAAFTVPTGQAHWHTLVRARAIENGCYVVAPAQTGTHDGGRQTFGHSLIVDPWGVVLADGGTETGIVYAGFEFSLVDAARAAVPSLSHDREFTVV